MRWDGWVFMILAWSGIIGLFVWAMARTLRSRSNSAESPSAGPDAPGSDGGCRGRTGP